MAEIDVHDLTRESLTSLPFPATRTETFRVHIAERVHQGVWKHASADTSHEICGVLVGSWAKDADGAYAQITEFIRCDNAAQKFAEVTFTHESWAQINGEMDTKYRDLRIIGWYHSHPNFGIFLSDRDCFIQEHFFSGPGQIAFVVDPVRKTEGIFEWRHGKPVPIHHYWVGDGIHLGVSQPPSPEGSPSGGMPLNADSAARSGRDESPYSPVLVMLIAVLTLLLGYMYGGLTTEWQRQRLAEGVVAHYELFKLAKEGFEEDLIKLINRQAKIAADLKEIGDQLPKADEENRIELEKMRLQRQADLAASILGLKDILDRYGLDESEQSAMYRLMREKFAIISAQEEEMKAQTSPPKSGAPPTEGTKDRKDTKESGASKQKKSGKAASGKETP